MKTEIRILLCKTSTLVKIQQVDFDKEVICPENEHAFDRLEDLIRFVRTTILDLRLPPV